MITPDVVSETMDGRQPRGFGPGKSPATITLSAFPWVPAFAQGLVRDFRVRWALEEAGIPYKERLLGPTEKNSASYLSLQPFGQVPAIEVDGLKLFESGAIVQHIAEQSDRLMPADGEGRVRTKVWIFAAINTVEPPIMTLGNLFFHAGEPWVEGFRPVAVADVRKRLAALETWLDGKDHLENRFTAADLLMATVLRSLRDTDLVTSRPVLKAYCERCEARPAFAKAMADHLRPFTARDETGALRAS